ncbi:hypothetical protein BC830DRAFT_889209 [Chytriomyces sp. MP71]|nr:hypothetical protein BC830DRAFT_889209 [Chytriomyces sp. MP71]
MRCLTLLFLCFPFLHKNFFSRHPKLSSPSFTPMNSVTNSLKTVLALCLFSAWQVAATVCVCTCNNIPTIVTGDCSPQACLTTFVAKDGYLNCTAESQWTAKSLDAIIAGGSTLFQKPHSTPSPFPFLYNQKKKRNRRWNRIHCARVLSRLVLLPRYLLLLLSLIGGV